MWDIIRQSRFLPLNLESRLFLPLSPHASLWWMLYMWSLQLLIYMSLALSVLELLWDALEGLHVLSCEHSTSLVFPDDNRYVSNVTLESFEESGVYVLFVCCFCFLNHSNRMRRIEAVAITNVVPFPRFRIGIGLYIYSNEVFLNVDSPFTWNFKHLPPIISSEPTWGLSTPGALCLLPLNNFFFCRKKIFIYSFFIILFICILEMVFNYGDFRSSNTRLPLPPLIIYSFLQKEDLYLFMCLLFYLFIL